MVAQDADLPMVMKLIVDELMSARARHNKLEGIRMVRARTNTVRQTAYSVLFPKLPCFAYVLGPVLVVS